MVCPYCKDEGKKSTVTPYGNQVSTLLGYSPGHYDETGEWVRHPDPNYHRRSYECSNGHRYTVTSKEGKPDSTYLNATDTTTLRVPR